MQYWQEPLGNEERTLFKQIANNRIEPITPNYVFTVSFSILSKTRKVRLAGTKYRV